MPIDGIKVPGHFTTGTCRGYVMDAKYVKGGYIVVNEYNDLATLTGAIMVALGDDYAGLFTNNSELFKQLKEAGENTEEKVWRMPLSEIGGFYDKQMDSDFADIKNAEKGRYGGSITAAQFLQRFINKHPKWAHIDIASTAYVAKEHYLTPKNATGYGVRLLNELVKKNYEK